MKRLRNEDKSVVKPDIEILVRVGNDERAVVAFFANAERDWDVLCGIEDITQRAAICVALSQAAEAMGSASFDGVDTNANDGGRPF